VSFDVFMRGFRAGDAADGDGAAAVAVLAPLVTNRDARWAHVTATDGEADVFGIDEPATGLTFHHASGRAIWQVMFDVARAGGFVVMPVGGPTCVPPGVAVEDVPDGHDGDVRTVTTGDELRRAITGIPDP
jgi:hypothetical protein